MNFTTNFAPGTPDIAFNPGKKFDLHKSFFSHYFKHIFIRKKSKSTLFKMKTAGFSTPDHINLC